MNKKNANELCCKETIADVENNPEFALFDIRQAFVMRALEIQNIMFLIYDSLCLLSAVITIITSQLTFSIISKSTMCLQS